MPIWNMLRRVDAAQLTLAPYGPRRLVRGEGTRDDRLRAEFVAAEVDLVAKQVAQRVGALAASVNAHVTDPAVHDAIHRDLEQLLAQGGGIAREVGHH